MINKQTMRDKRRFHYECIFAYVLLFHRVNKAYYLFQQQQLLIIILYNTILHHVSIQTVCTVSKINFLSDSLSCRLHVWQCRKHGKRFSLWNSDELCFGCVQKKKCETRAGPRGCQLKVLQMLLEKAESLFCSSWHWNMFTYTNSFHSNITIEQYNIQLLLTLPQTLRLLKPERTCLMFSSSLKKNPAK